jgi:hypothetical protein
MVGSGRGRRHQRKRDLPMAPPVTVGVATGRPSINAMRLRSLTQDLIFGNEPKPPASAAVARGGKQRR